MLPSRKIEIEDSAVFWPLQRSPLFRLTGVFDPVWAAPRRTASAASRRRTTGSSGRTSTCPEADSDSDSDD